jgi:gamma-glutamylcyclotransferase (GGCT)/AIG2-like uncharacterized protein YtfP
MGTRDLFVYGTLAFDGVLKALLGHIPNKKKVAVKGFEVTIIHLDGWQPFPVMVGLGEGSTKIVDGYILQELTDIDFNKLDRYEFVQDGFYVRKELTVASGEVADFYEPADNLFKAGRLGKPWDLDRLDPVLESIYVDSVVPEFKLQHPDLF